MIGATMGLNLHAGSVAVSSSVELHLSPWLFNAADWIALLVVTECSLGVDGVVSLS